MPAPVTSLKSTKRISSLNEHDTGCTPRRCRPRNLYVLLLCLIILAVAGTVMALHGETQTVVAVPSHQLDARRDLSAAEQGIYADLRVSLDEIHWLQQEQNALPTPAQRGGENRSDGRRRATAGIERRRRRPGDGAGKQCGSTDQDAEPMTSTPTWMASCRQNSRSQSIKR